MTATEVVLMIKAVVPWLGAGMAPDRCHDDGKVDTVDDELSDNVGPFSYPSLADEVER